MANRIKQSHRKAIEDYSQMLLGKLRLEDWRVHVEDEVPEDNSDSSAEVASRPNHKLAVIRIGDRFFDDDDVPDTMRTQVLIHEHCHLYFEHAWHFVFDVFEQELGRQGKEIAQHTFVHEMEIGLDQLSWALADMLPAFKLPK